MNAAEFVVTAASVASIGLLAWFFFGPRAAHRAEVRGGMQEVEITVKGGYVPNLIRVRQEVPLRVEFDRQENSDCISRVVFPDFSLSKSLVAFGKTAERRRGHLPDMCAYDRGSPGPIAGRQPGRGQLRS